MRTPKILVLERSAALADQVRQVCEPLAPEVVACPRVTDVGDLLTTGGPFDVLVAGPSMATRSGLARLEVIHDELPTMPVVLAFARRPDAKLRDIIRVGAIDLLSVPVEDDELRSSLERAVEVSGQAAQASTTSFAPVLGRDGDPGRVFTIASATGGCGKTFYATNLAYFLAHHTGKRVCLVDLDLQFGEVSTALRLRPKFTIYDALQREEADQATVEAHLEEYLVAHETGVHVLAAPKDPAEADRISPPDVTRVVDIIRRRFDYVVVDTPAQLSEVVLAAFDLSDLMYSMATLDLPSVRNMSVFLHTLEKLKIPGDNIRLILNKAETDVGIDVEQVEKLFPRGFTSVLPYAKEVSRSINLGVPVMACSPNADVSRRLAAGMVDLLPERERNLAKQARAAAPTGLFGRLRRTVAPVH